MILERPVQDPDGGFPQFRQLIFRWHVPAEVRNVKAIIPARTKSNRRAFPRCTAMSMVLSHTLPHVNILTKPLSGTPDESVGPLYENGDE